MCAEGRLPCPPASCLCIWCPCVSLSSSPKMLPSWTVSLLLLATVRGEDAVTIPLVTVLGWPLGETEASSSPSP